MSRATECVLDEWEESGFCLDLATGAEETEVGWWVVPLMCVKMIDACANIAHGDIGLRIGCGEDVFVDLAARLTG
jgi:hypothetical protein